MHINLKMNIITILYCLLFSAATVGAEQVSVSDYISQCVDEYSAFTVKLGYNKDTWVESKCIRSYDRCAVSNSDGCAGGDSWTSSSGDSFNYLTLSNILMRKDPVSIWYNTIRHVL